MGPAYVEVLAEHRSFEAEVVAESSDPTFIDVGDTPLGDSQSQRNHQGLWEF
jgi:hypothetical protein